MHYYFIAQLVSRWEKNPPRQSHSLPSPPRYSKFSMAMSKMSPSVYISASDSQRQAGREGRTADTFHKSAMILFFVSMARVSARRNENTAVAVSVSFPSSEKCGTQNANHSLLPLSRRSVTCPRHIASDEDTPIHPTQLKISLQF